MPFRRILTFLALAGAMAIQASAFDPETDVSVAYEKGAVVITAPKGAHIKKSFTEVTLASKPGSLKAGPLPRADAKDELNEDIYHGAVRIPVAGSGLKGEVALDVQYQPCTEGAGGNCFPPTTRRLKVAAAEIPALKESVPAPKAVAPEVEPAPAPELKAAPPQAPPPPAPAPAEPRRGFLISLIVVFLAGMGASLTPCVYPMIPITMAIIGAKRGDGGGRLKGFSLSMALVLGMAVTYTALGVVAARSGATFGAFAQKPAFLVPVSVLFAAFSLSLFGAFELALPQGLQNRLQGGGPRKGYLGAFFMGLVLGPLAAPCVGPIIGTVLVGIAQQGDAVRGGIQLFTFAIGMGVLFLVVGTFSAALPRSGDWLTRFKYVMGLVVLGFAAWNVRLVVPEWASFLMWTVTALAGAAVFGAFEPGEGLTGQIRKGFAIFLVALAVLLGFRAVETGLDLKLLPAPAAAAAEKAPGAWGTDYEKALAQAKAEGKLVLLDTFAVWCAQCKELDEKTWPDPQVAAWIKDNAVPVKIDADKVRPDLARSLRIRSFPTVVLLDGDGREVRRSLGFRTPADMLTWLRH
ncbi:protein-disulfide reductase DsbD family protein [Mesoterricola silvestris]|uniref:Thiol:disulfide interchange protein DsbD n=1 Tax=Mesoterricola silvestris TaxID=2927979 RepID=A0AA48GUP7_9BACT|nr:cytochrome c biogenesis protein CcdA [Mesoterricola silvestris]BDU72136.1 thiol:disulfide interchange protein DsbD [Mesoterricola silvestris]